MTVVHNKLVLVMKRALYDILWRFGNKHSGKLIPLLLDISYIFDRPNEDVTS